MDQHEKVENMKARMESLTKTVGSAMSQTAFFAAALHDELADDMPGGDTEAEFVARQLGSINDRLAEIFTELHELPSHLY